MFKLFIKHKYKLQHQRSSAKPDSKVGIWFELPGDRPWNEKRLNIEVMVE
jgi:hypothetical protein